MAWRKCAVFKCSHQVREGLKRFGKGVHGQELADGTYCWRCRRRQASPGPKPKKEKP